MHGPQQRRQLPRLLDLGAQAMDVHVNRAFVTVEIEAPDPLQKPVARKRDAGIAGQFHQQRELAWLELHVDPVDARLARPCVDLEPPKVQDRAGCGTARPLRRRIDLIRATTSRGENGLLDVIVGAELKAEHAVDLVGARGEHDDRHVAFLAAKRSHDVVTVDSR